MSNYSAGVAQAAEVESSVVEQYQGRLEQVRDSRKKDAEAKMEVLLQMLKNSDPLSTRRLAELTMAAEVTADAVMQLYKVNLDGVEYGLA